MEALNQERIIQEIISKAGMAHGCSLEELAQMRVDAYNNSVGNLGDYDCPICKNKGYVQYVGKNAEEITRECECMPIRITRKTIRESGLSNILNKCTFANFQTHEKWQENARDMAKRFVTDHENKWFFAGGQVGCGKTHLCTAIVGEFLSEGIRAKYMLWRDEATKLKSIIMDDDYGIEISKIEQIPVLYIDDFFKTEKGKKPTTSDVNIAFEILNYRYMNPGLITIISSELTVDDIIDIDQAVGSRIYERSKGSCLCIGQDIKKNYRLR